MSCEHDSADHDVAWMDGMCTLCQRAEITALREQLIEQVKRCAEIMGIDVVEQLGGLHRPFCQLEDSLYNPLANDAQCMALVKRFQLTVEWVDAYEAWCVMGWQGPESGWSEIQRNADLNAAIVSVVAQMKGVG